MKFSHIRNMREAKRRRFLRDPLFPLHLELHRLDCIASHGKLDVHDFALAAWEKEAARTPEPAPLLTGRNLMDMGYEPGPQMGRILRALEDARLEKRVVTAEDARAWVRANYPTH